MAQPIECFLRRGQALCFPGEVVPSGGNSRGICLPGAPILSTKTTVGLYLSMLVSSNLSSERPEVGVGSYSLT